MIPRWDVQVEGGQSFASGAQLVIASLPALWGGPNRIQPIAITHDQLWLVCQCGPVSFFDGFPEPLPLPKTPDFSKLSVRLRFWWLRIRRKNLRSLPPEAGRTFPGPPPDWLGGWVPWHVELARTDDHYVAVMGAVVYPTGATITIACRSRIWSGKSGDGVASRSVHERPGPFGGVGGKLGVAFADGQKVALLETMSARDDTQPGLVVRSGGGSTEEWAVDLWLWPLPPPGPLTIAMSWTERGISEREVLLDASELMNAAEKAERLWPNDEPGGSTRITTFIPPPH